MSGFGWMTHDRQDDGIQNRERWLLRFVDEVRPWFEKEGAKLGAVRVSVGFPSRGALSRSRKRIGECWAGSTAADGLPQLFISPLLGQADVGHVLIHELVHASVGCQCGHKGPFRKLAKALGLTGKMTATVAGDELKVRLSKLEETLGPYPHAPLSAVDPSRKKQGTRLLLLECACEPARKIRLSRACAEQGPILCGLCSAAFEGDLGEEEEVGDEARPKKAAARNGGVR